MADIFQGASLGPTLDSGLSGVAGLTAQLKALGALEDGKVLRAAVRAGMRPAYERAVAMAPEGEKMHRTYKGRLVAPGFTKRSIRFIASLSPDKQRCTAVLGVRKEAFYAIQFIELGTAKYPAHPWLLPAFYSTKQQQEEALAESLKVAITRITLQSKGKARG